MPAQIATSVENNFTKGLITEATGLNFPENAATDTVNCEYTLIGDVIRREGINFEANGTTFSASVASQALSTYVWNNPGGDGNSKLMVKQIGSTLYFYNIATSTTAAPLSTQKLAGTVTITAASGNVLDATKEVSYADGNGYLFLYHTSCDPSYVTYDPVSKALAIFPINLQIRDFVGVVDGLAVSTRPVTLSDDHKYNLQNQGWTSSNPWLGTDTTSSYTSLSLGSRVFTIASGLTIANGTVVSILGQVSDGHGGFTTVVTASGTVTNYTGTALTINITSSTGNSGAGGPCTKTVITPISTGYITTWNTSQGNYPSNADVWWYFKNSSLAFDPTTTAPNVTLATGQAPQGHYILNVFNQDRAGISGIGTITPVTTTARPTNGCWFQGRVWYTGINAQQQATGDSNYYTWTENIYFSQIVSTAADFGVCYQTNDPSSETLNGLLPTDGGVITIPGTGTIHRLFPIANGLLVYATNGVWFITGSQGIGFSANDYTITQISHASVIGRHSFVDVLGLPYYWNEDGIYETMVEKSGKLAVAPITVGTIQTYYDAIPLSSKKYARGAYDPINFTIQWCFKTTQEVSVTDRYQYDAILNYNTYNKAFFPYEISTTNQSYIHGVDYVSYPYIATATPLPGFKYHCSSAAINNGFAEEYDTTYVDWGSVDYTSYFITGYKVHGKGLMRFQVPYLNIFTRDVGFSQFYLQSVWDFGTKNFNSNKWSTPQLIEINESNTEVSYRRLRLRGRGVVMQIKVTSITGKPFDLMGWGMYEVINAGI